MSDLKALQSDLDLVFGKVHAWSLSKEKNLNDLKSSHNAFLDTQNGDGIVMWNDNWESSW